MQVNKKTLYKHQERNLGVDLTLQPIQIIQLYQQNNCYLLNKHLRIFLPDSKLKNKLAYLARLRKQLSANNLHNKMVRIAIPDAHTIQKVITCSTSLSHRDLDELAKIEALKMLPGSLDSLCFDYSMSAPSASKQEMLIVMARRKDVLQKTSILTDLGLRLGAVDTESNCILRVIRFLQEKKVVYCSTSTFVWIEFGGYTLQTYLIRQDKVIFWHEDIVSKLLSTKQETIALAACTHLERTFKYFKAIKNSLDIQQAYLSGSFARLVYLQGILQEKLSIPVIIVNPFQYVNFANNFIKESVFKHSNKLIVALGLALSE